MPIYATKQGLLDRDSSTVWNLAIDRETNELNEASITDALEQADNEINSFLAKRYVLPLVEVPSMLSKLAITISFYFLADSDQQATN